MPSNLSPALRELVDRRDRLQAAYARALVANKGAHEKEATLEASYKEALAKRYLIHRTASDGKRATEKDATAAAELDTAQLHLELLVARGLRRASAEALSVWEKDLEFLTAAVHCINRELKTLGG